ncbi:hypothetical protein B0O99DRAFT_655114 [Bisporella sp. PMI_857]|nr:hypothetical protein B0O99DRAFT_655114 [Bisporella sp. PMI_857]
MLSGLPYRCGSTESTTTPAFVYTYEPGSMVTFLVGCPEIGQSVGKPMLTISDLVPIDTSEFDPKLINRARLLYSLTPAQGFWKPIVIDRKLAPKLVSLARDHLRREAAGFKVIRDIQIPTRDEGHVLGDVCLPPQHELGEIFSIAIQLHRGSWGTSWESQRGFENIAIFNTFTHPMTAGARGVPGEIVGDFYDAAEWAAGQSWSDGSVALVRSSYEANTQWNVASLWPKGLKCFVPCATSHTHRHLSDWHSRVQKPSPKRTDHLDLLKMMKSYPFYDGVWEFIGTKSDQQDLPCFWAAAQVFIIHGLALLKRGERGARHENTHFQLLDCNYYPLASHEAAGKILQFLGHHLKGVEYPKLERVGIQMRLSYKMWYWRKGEDWPVPGMHYIEWYLGVDGSPPRDEPRESEKQFFYSTIIPPYGRHFAAVLSISSSLPGADVVVSFYRKTDPSKSLAEQPRHTHRQEDNAPLIPGEVVQLEVEIFPAAGRIRKGWKLRADISSSEQPPEIAGYNPYK